MPCTVRSKLFAVPVSCVTVTYLVSMRRALCTASPRELHHSRMCYKTLLSGQFVAQEAFPTFPPNCLPEYAKLATECMAEDPSHRPAMSFVVASLKDMRQQVMLQSPLRVSSGGSVSLMMS